MITSKIKVIIADDHELLRDGLRMLLGKEEDIEIIAEAHDGETLIELAKQFNPDVILTDLRMPGINGVQAIKEIRALGLTARCIVLSNFDSDYMIVESLEAGAIGYINKNAQRGEIVDAIKTVYEHHAYYCKSTSLKLIKKISKSAFNPQVKASRALLSDDEKQIIRLVCQEKTSEEIGRILFMSNRTVEGFRTRILDKTNVRTPIGLVIYAIQNGIFNIDAG